MDDLKKDQGFEYDQLRQGRSPLELVLEASVELDNGHHTDGCEEGLNDFDTDEFVLEAGGQWAAVGCECPSSHCTGQAHRQDLEDLDPGKVEPLEGSAIVLFVAASRLAVDVGEVIVVLSLVRGKKGEKQQKDSYQGETFVEVGNWLQIAGCTVEPDSEKVEDREDSGGEHDPDDLTLLGRPAEVQEMADGETERQDQSDDCRDACDNSDDFVEGPRARDR